MTNRERRLRTVVLAGWAFVGGCGGSTVLPVGDGSSNSNQADASSSGSSGGSSSGGSSSGGSSSASSGAGGAPATRDAQPGPVELQNGDGASCTVSALCALHEQPIASVTSQQGQSVFIERIVGDWALCGTTSVFGTHEAGLSIAADGTWYKLYVSGAALMRGQGFSEQGTWSIVDTSVMNGPNNPFQLNFDEAGGGIGTFPAFAIQPRKMRLNNEGVFVADYVFAACP